ncbi:MAG: hypothetical protein ERJ67_00875 [Aphanocapsa feldmannii 277cV]|uniref:Guanylate cyclase domain-containing protein n=1 Tax=Aphanocapsa feldmannii 277cV TaxID=2507553 RepID=A0A524RRZ2_9CHRO|nr:MAG: hypothetical protein ERJ67_00875 [Aphanocapsa feldmannii 277cV]
MSTEPLFIDFSDLNIGERVSALEPKPGICVFIDIVGSTAMKQESMQHWIGQIGNAFSYCNALLAPFRPLKGIGDELMYFIEDADRGADGQTPLQIYDALFQIANPDSPNIPQTKIVAAHCCNVFALTFLQGKADYYGLDIDLTARLKSVQPAPKERELIIDHGFYNKIKEDYDKTGNQSDFYSFTKLHGPHTFSARGLPEPVTFYRAQA